MTASLDNNNLLGVTIAATSGRHGTSTAGASPGTGAAGTSTTSGTTSANLQAPDHTSTDTTSQATTIDTTSQATITNTTSQATTSGIAHPPGHLTPTDISKGNQTSSLSSSTSTAATSSSTQVSDTGGGDMGKYTTGALAGAIVGSIIGAAIVTFLITWLFFGKRNKRDQRNQRTQRAPSHRSSSRDHRSPGRSLPPTPKVAAAGLAEKSLSSSADSGFSWQAYLPQSADDQTVSRDVKTLFDQIELHVDNYYTKANVRIDSGTSRALSQFDNGDLPDSIDRLIANPQTTLPTIKHCIASALLARMSPGYEHASLLPQYLAVEPTKLNSSMPQGEHTAAQQAYSQWRLLNAYLHPQPQQDRSYQSRREIAARDISEQLSDTFGLWQGPEQNHEGLKQHEKSLVMRAGDVACLIMSQPSAYEFQWNSGQNASSRSFVVFPGFWKTTDERGRPLEQQQPLVAPVFPRL